MGTYEGSQCALPTVASICELAIAAQVHPSRKSGEGELRQAGQGLRLALGPLPEPTRNLPPACSGPLSEGSSVRWRPPEESWRQ